MICKAAVKVDAVKVDAGRSESGRSESGRSESGRSESGRSDSEDDAPRGRSRRRGRRGRGRGRGRDTADAGGDVQSDPRSTSNLASDPLDRPSAFDDDHEDDLEVEVIRKVRCRRTASREDNNDRDDSPDRARNRDRGETDDQAPGS